MANYSSNNKIIQKSGFFKTSIKEENIWHKIAQINIADDRRIKSAHKEVILMAEHILHIYNFIPVNVGLPRWCSGKRIHLPMQRMQEMWIQPLGQEDPLEKEMQPTPVFLPGKSHGQRSMVGYSPWGRKELDMT